MRRKFIDIGANLTDPQFYGVYRGKQKHASDFEAMLARARAVGCTKMLVTGSNLKESRKAMDLCAAHPNFLYSTCGVHPCDARNVGLGQPQEGSYWRELEALAKEGAATGLIRAFGEIGLDYDRLHYASVEEQKTVFTRQLEIAACIDLPLFLHMRACADDFAAILGDWIQQHPQWRGGVVHSFTGSLGDLELMLKLGVYIGVNGCSLKTQDNLDVVKRIPLDRLMLETDGPWCEIRPSHASSQYTKPLPYDATKPEKWKEGAMVRGRCEPAQIENVAQVVAAVKELSVDEVCAAALANSERLFWPSPNEQSE